MHDRHTSFVEKFDQTALNHSIVSQRMRNNMFRHLIATGQSDLVKGNITKNRGTSYFELKGDIR